MLQINDGKLRHIFFVLNDFALREEEKQEAWEAARTMLEGLIDDFDKQVFMINAYDALQAKRDGETGDSLEKTGLPEFQRILESSLIEQKQLVLETATARRVAPIVVQARNEVVRQNALLDTSIKEVENAVKEASDALKISRQKGSKLIKDFNNASSEIAQDAADNFQHYFAQRITESEWRKELADDPPDIGYFELAKSIMPGKKAKTVHRPALEKKIKQSVERLIGRKVDEWSKQLPQALEDKTKALSDIVEAGAEEVASAIIKSDEKLVENIKINVGNLNAFRTDENWKRVSQMFLGVLIADPNQLFGTIYAPDWGSFFRRLFIDFAIIGTSVVIFGPPRYYTADNNSNSGISNRPYY